MPYNYHAPPTTGPKKGKLKVLARLTVIFKPYKLRLLFAFMALTIAAAAVLALPLALRQLIDQVFSIQQQPLTAIFGC